MDGSTSVITTKVYRFSMGQDSKGYFQNFEIESEEPLSVLILLEKIHNIDPTVAYRSSTCFKGQCSGCLIRVNGQNVLGCTRLVSPGETVIIEPNSKFKVIRDTVVNFRQPLVPEERD